MHSFSLNDKVALVTGACGLLGNMHCKALQYAGAKVIATDVFSEGPDLEGVDEYWQMDVTNSASIAFVLEEIKRKFGQLDVLINNAAVNDMFENPQLKLEQSRFENYPLEMWRKSLDVNLTGVFLCCQVLGTYMAGTGKGSIINIASTYGVVAPDQQLYVDRDGNQTFFKSIAYPTTKAGVLSMTRFLASYWGPTGLRVNALSPGGVQNQQSDWFVQQYASRTSLRRMACPEDYAGAVIFLASDASSYMTGANLVVDGGWTII